ncbi:MAG: hypothetical protein EOP62_14200 [Sphingomonadales bacterium]|nr:MAG: hypothetical protein EOP62_14200 [Sphingomonadales bacterium]
MHRIDVKAALQKKFGSVASFERKHDLPEKSVNDVLRGRPWKRVADAIEKALATEEGTPAESEFSDCSKGCATSHRLIEGAR